MEEEPVAASQDTEPVAASQDTVPVSQLITWHYKYDLLAGAVGGACGATIGQPFDTVKTRAQVLGSKFSIRAQFQPFSASKVLATTKDLYKGLSGPLLGSVAINALVFATEEIFMNSLQSNTWQTHVVSGSLAGGVQSIGLAH